MKVSMKCLKQYADIPVTPEEYESRMVMTGTGVEGVEPIAPELEGVVVGKVLTCRAHENSDHLHVCTVDVGEAEPLQIVCGAPNVTEGILVPVAKIGAKLPGGVTIKKGKMRGVESFGMLCSGPEIGVPVELYPSVGTAGLLIFREDHPLGADVKPIFGLDDTVIDFEILANRPDCLCVWGVARETAVAMGTELKLPEITVKEAGGDIHDYAKVDVLESELCPRYAAKVIKNVRVGESPYWLRQYLYAAGMRSINNIVDITNYILLGTGQPMHCFDLSKVKGDRIVVRTVEPGTKFVTLDGVERTLTDRDLMICNGEEPMCIGGVFGGLDSGVTESTTDVFLESAYFHPTWIRKTARRFGLNTDASFRFERGIDPNEVIYNLKLAAMLVKELAGGEICGDIIDVKAHDFPGFPVELRYDYVKRLIGKDIPHNEIRDIVQCLEMDITAEDDEKINLVVPTYRVDVRRPCDVVEDILRVYGYNNVEFTSEVHSSLSNKTDVDFRDDKQEIISNQLSSIGYHEIMNNSLTVGNYYEGLTTYPADLCVRIMNPLSSDLNVMRQTLLFGGLESIARNINHKNPNLRLYEFGNVYRHDGSISQDEKALAPYSESTQMAMWITGNNHDESWADKVRALNVYDLKADLENMLVNLGINLHDLVVEQCEDEILNPALRYSNRGGKTIAVMGVVDEALAHKHDVDQPVYYAQIDWNQACKMAMKKDIKYADLPKTLPLRRDLALLVDRTVTYDDIRRVVESSEKKLLKSMTLFDVYESNKLEAGKKSYAISMILQDNEKTLNDKQIDAIMNKIIKNLETQLGAKLR